MNALVSALSANLVQPFFWWFWSLFLLGTALGLPLGRRIRKGVSHRRRRVLAARALAGRALSTADSASDAEAFPEGRRRKGLPAHRNGHKAPAKASGSISGATLWHLARNPKRGLAKTLLPFIFFLLAILGFVAGSAAASRLAENKIYQAWEEEGLPGASGPQELFRHYLESMWERWPGMLGFLFAGFLLALLGPVLRMLAAIAALSLLVIGVSSQLPGSSGAVPAVLEFPLAGEDGSYFAFAMNFSGLAQDLPEDQRGGSSYWRATISGWQTAAELRAFAWPALSLGYWELKAGKVGTIDLEAANVTYGVLADPSLPPLSGIPDSSLPAIVANGLSGLGLTREFAFRSNYFEGLMSKDGYLVFTEHDFPFFLRTRGR